MTGRLRLVSALFVIGTTCPGCASPAQPTATPSEPSILSIAGRWTGSASDSSGPGQMIWQIGQAGASFSGTLISTDAATNITGRGSVSGSVSGSSIHFSIAVPAGGFDTPFASCSADISGDAQVSASSITGTYSGINSCSGAITSGQLALTRSG